MAAILFGMGGHGFDIIMGGHGLDVIIHGRAWAKAKHIERGHGMSSENYASM